MFVAFSDAVGRCAPRLHGGSHGGFPHTGVAGPYSLASARPHLMVHEREAFDLLGHRPVHHGDLRRLVGETGLRGFPLRKDFPVVGYLEAHYIQGPDRIVRLATQLAQDMRLFDAW